MTKLKFNDLLRSGAHDKPLEFPSVSVTLKDHTLHLRFSSKDEVVDATYEGKVSSWLGALCSMIIGKRLTDLSNLSWKEMEDYYQDDQGFWDHRQEEESFVPSHFELLHAALDIYQGREHLYHDESPLVCRCFGIREKDILAHLQTEKHPTLETLAGATKAGMGCRSCVPQINRWLQVLEEKKRNHHYKEKTIADWLLDIDYMLSCFPKSLEWKMEVESFKGNQVIISYHKDASQKEEETISKELQDFLGASVDPDLGFFLRRARHFSNAKG